MYATKKTKNRRGFTLIELMVVMAIILAIAALAAAFAPRVTDSTNLTRSVDQLEQWLLTAKMRAKRDGLATGLRFIATPGDATTLAGTYSQFQYIQQPDPLSGGWLSSTATTGSVPFGPGLFLTGGILTAAGSNRVTFANVDFTLGGVPNAAQWLVQPGDYLEVRDGGVYLIAGVIPTATLTLAGTAYDSTLSITQATTNYRILRQPRLLEGEPVLQMPGNFAVDATIIPATVIPGNTTITWSNVVPRTVPTVPPVTYYEILFSPSGAVIGTNAGSGKILLFVHDTTQPLDLNKAGIVAVQSRTGFIGAYSVAPGAGIANYDPFAFAEIGRQSGL